jgi:serine/threonine protein kinase
LLIGSILGDRYRLLEVIGEGGMGCVFRAEQLATGQTVALKLLQPEFSTVEQVVRRFEREAQVTSRLSHPNIVKVVEFGESSGGLFLVMEFLEGRSLDAVIKQGDSPKIGRLRRALGHGARNGRGLTVERTLTIMRPVLDALEYAHSLGVVHRDLKPENIMLIPPRGLLSRERVKLLDFGIAKLEDDGDAAAQRLTQLGLTLGTPGYMSPEQAMGQKADARSDLYSCGVILHEMLTGQRLFEADSSLQVLAMHLNATPTPLRALATKARISAALENVVLRALAKQPGDRFQSAGELREAVERAAMARDRSTDVSGLAKTMVASRPTPQVHPRWMRVSMVAVAAVFAAMVIGDHHLRPKVPTGSRRIASSEARSSVRRASAVASATRAAPSHEPARQAAPAVARGPSEQTRNDVGKRRTTSKGSKLPKLRKR